MFFDMYFKQTIELIEETHKLGYKQEVQNLFIILTTYAEIGNIHNHPNLNNMLLDLERISNLITPKLKENTHSVTSKNEVCFCVEKILKNQLNEECNLYLNNIFNKIKSEQ